MIKVKRKRKKTINIKKRKASFGKIWLGISVPVLLLTMAALIVWVDIMIIFLALQRQMIISEAAFEKAHFLQEQELTSFEENSKLLHMEGHYGSSMVAALYDDQGELIGESNIDDYESDRFITKEDCQLALKRLEEIQLNDFRGMAGFEEFEPFGNSYLYGKEPVWVNGKSYTLRFAGIICPLRYHGKSFVTMGLFVIAGVLVLSTLIARYFYHIYQVQLKAEEYYRNTSNALAHDLKTPLMAISGYAEILRENVHNEKKDYYAEAILKNVSAMKSIIENMLELAKLENPGIILVKEEVSLYDLTMRVLEQFQVEIEEKELKVEVTGDVCLFADRPLMRRALENLISNGVKYTPYRHEIKITMDGEKYQIVNTGVRIDAEKAEHLWEPFVKGESARGDVTGTGIGLTIVKDILDLHSFGYQMENYDDGVSVKILF